MSYRSVLDRGFALVSTDGEPVRSAAAVPRGKVLDIEFRDGHVAAVSSGLTPPPRRKRRGPDDGSQGSLSDERRARRSPRFRDRSGLLIFYLVLGVVLDRCRAC